MVINIFDISLFIWVMMHARNSLEYYNICSITSEMDILQLIVIDSPLAFKFWIPKRIISSFLSSSRFVRFGRIMRSYPYFFIRYKKMTSLFYFISYLSSELIALIEVGGFTKIYFGFYYALHGHWFSPQLGQF